jgi:ABC-type branched-subunit amino acid transport system permease subunit
VPNAGGIGSFEGPIIGTIVFFVMRQYLGNLASCRAT